MELHIPQTREPISPAPIATGLKPSQHVPAPTMDLEDFYCVLQVTPNDSFMATELAKRLKSMGRYSEALKIQRNVVKIDSRFATVHALGQLEYLMELYDESFRHLQEALLLAPDSSPEFFELFKTLGNIFVRRGDFDSAEDNYNKAHRIKPDSDVLAVNFGTLLIQRSQWDEALSQFRQAIALCTTNDKAWVGLAICHRFKGDLELAWGNLEAALNYNPVNDVALGLVLEWAAQDNLESRALELVRRFLIHGGWNEKMSLAFAWLTWKRGEKSLAQLELERLLSVNPNNARAMALLQEMRQAAC